MGKAKVRHDPRNETHICDGLEIRCPSEGKESDFRMRELFRPKRTLSQGSFAVIYISRTIYRPIRKSDRLSTKRRLLLRGHVRSCESCLIAVSSGATANLPNTS